MKRDDAGKQRLGVIVPQLFGHVVERYIMGKPVPPELFNLLLFVLGYYFGIVSEKARLTTK